MQILELNGKWNFRQKGDTDSHPAIVPGCVHQDLLRNKIIEDPFYRENELKSMWVGEKNWIYSRSFEVTEDLLSEKAVFLECDGLDTLTSIRINGRHLATTDNMFRAWAFDVKSLLSIGANTIEITFKSVIPVGKAGLAKRPLRGGGGPLVINGAQYVRKEPCNYGWDWGPRCLTCGIWRSIRLRAYSDAIITDVHITQKHLKGRQVELQTTVQAEQFAKKTALKVRLKVLRDADEKVVADTELKLLRGGAVCNLKIGNPELWWPNGMGDQPLYRVIVELFENEGSAVDTWSRRIGLRTLELIREKDKWGESFVFACNGKRFFAKGANWIPADVFQGRVTRDKYEYLLQSSVEANFNMLRVWGGGIYEQDEFYDLCDELGICVWQDFMFACQPYPAFDSEFMANVEAEAIYNIRRLRHHASIALYCGNNELEQLGCIDDSGGPFMTWDEYKQLFDRLLPRLVRKYDGERAYWPSSEHTPCGDRTNTQNQSCGDGHVWDVWHCKQPFEWYRTSLHRFCSEYGFQSFPEPKTCQSFTLPEERNITSHVMEHHQRCMLGNEKIIQYMTSWYRLPVGFENTVWLSQIQHGMSVKYAVEHWRRNMPRCMGSLYWQLNDCWPVASWASIDSFNRWKALHFMAKRFYAPVLVSGLEDTEKGTVEVHVSSDLRKPDKGVLLYRITQVDGTVIDEQKKPVNIPANANRKVITLRLRSIIAKYTERDLMIWLSLRNKTGNELSSNFVSFCRPKHMALQYPGIKAKVSRHSSGAFKILLTTKRPALWVWLELDGHNAQFGDNFICLQPGEEAKMLVSAKSVNSIEAFKKVLRIRSIWDTYQEV